MGGQEERGDMLPVRKERLFGGGWGSRRKPGLKR
jgi:hypothetical protein